MPAAVLDIVLEEGSNLSYQFTYRDADGNAIDVTGYGATLIIGDDNKKKIFEVDDSLGDITIGTTDGKITLSVSHTHYANFEHNAEGVWQLYIYPLSGSPNSSPKRLVEGTWIYSAKAKEQQ